MSLRGSDIHFLFLKERIIFVYRLRGICLDEEAESWNPCTR